jgi:hypothetical protein
MSFTVSVRADVLIIAGLLCAQVLLVRITKHTVGLLPRLTTKKFARDISWLSNTYFHSAVGGLDPTKITQMSVMISEIGGGKVLAIAVGC